MSMTREEYLGWVGTATAVASALGKGIGSISKAVKKKKAKRRAAAQKKGSALIRRLMAKVKEKQATGEIPASVKPESAAKAILEKAKKVPLVKMPSKLKRRARIVRRGKGRGIAPVERVQVKEKLDTMRKAPVYAPQVSRGPAPVYEPAVIPAPRMVERQKAGPGMMLPIAIGAGALMLMLATKKGK